MIPKMWLTTKISTIYSENSVEFFQCLFNVILTKTRNGLLTHITLIIGPHQGDNHSLLFASLERVDRFDLQFGMVGGQTFTDQLNLWLPIKYSHCII